MIRVLHRPKLPFQKYCLPFLNRLKEKCGGIAYIRLHHPLIFHQLFIKLFLIKRRLVIQMLKKGVLLNTHIGNLLPKIALPGKQLAYLKANLCKFIRIKRSNPRLGRAKGFSAQTLLLALIKENMIGHHHLRPIRHQNLRSRNAALHNALNLPEQHRNIERHAIADDACGVIIKYAGGKCVQGKFSIIVHNGVACICPSLKADNNIRLLSQHIGNLALSFISPVCSNNCFNHSPDSSIPVP